MLRLSFPGFVEFPLRSWRGRWALLAAVGLAATLMAAEALRVAIAASLGDSLDLRRVQMALALDPSNPLLHRRLGQVYLFVLQDLDAEEGVKHMRRATELNPRLASSWTDLGRACDLIRDLTCADRAFEQALGLNPMSADLRWVIGNHYLVTRRSDLALGQFHRLLELNTRYAAQTFSLCLRVVNDPEVIFEKLLPAPEKDPKLCLAFISFLIRQGRVEEASQAWVRTFSKTSKLEFLWVKPYLDELLERREYERATKVWRDLERAGVLERPKAEDADNRVFNGDFEQDPLDAGLDWRFKKELYLAADFSDPSAFHGRRCLRLDFTVNRNEEYEPVYQIVPVDSNQSYSLSAYVRSDDLTSDSGPRLRVIDPACPECLNIQSETTVGTTPWHPLSLQFSTGAKTRWVRISVWRPRGRTFPAGIGGRFWLDTVSLKALGLSGEKASLTRTH